MQLVRHAAAVAHKRASEMPMEHANISRRMWAAFSALLA
jgi:hypothetical protein